MLGCVCSMEGGWVGWFELMDLFWMEDRDLFEWIELEPSQFWHSLLFMDQVHILS